jgi:hypothetical protein
MIERGLLAISEREALCHSALWIAFQKFKGTLSTKEVELFSGASLEDFMYQIHNLDKRHFFSSTTRRIINSLEPFIQFLDRNASSLDSIAQAPPNPSILIWGLMRAVFEVRFCKLGLVLSCSELKISGSQIVFGSLQETCSHD